MAREKGNSLFSYPLSRPYPFQWFTYVVAIGGTICIVLFTFVALAGDGYNLDLQYTLDLNRTLNESYWFQKAPFSWVSKTKVSCQPALLTSGSTYFTSNLGFKYTLDELRQEGSNGAHRILPAAAYQNALLEGCDVLSIEIDLSREDQTVLRHDSWTWSATTASATVSCSFETSSGRVVANLTTQLPSINQIADRGHLSVQSLVLSANIYEFANMWFGAQLTFAWYAQLSSAMDYQQTPPESFGNSTWDSGTVMLSRNPAVVDYTSLEFFFSNTFFYTDNGLIAFMHPPLTLADWANPVQSGGLGLPNITTTVDTFAKSIYSLLLTDFGVGDQANALNTPSGIQWLQNQVDLDLKGQRDTVNNRYLSGRPLPIPNAVNVTGRSYPINQTYQLVVEGLGAPPDLNITKPSAIFMQYLCSIPQRKGGGALFFAVLLADLVFLQAAWTLLNLIATWWLQRKYDHTNYCEGCHAVSTPAVRAPGVKRKVSDYQSLQANSTTSSSVSVLLSSNKHFVDGVYARGGRVDERGEI